MELMTIRPNTPIILCTGFSENIDERRADEMGIRAFEMKPIFMRDIAKTFREVLDHYEFWKDTKGTWLLSKIHSS